MVPQELVYDPFFSVWEMLTIQAGYFGLGAENEPWLREVLEELDLADKAAMTPRELSGGMKRRLLIAQALAHRPRVVVLDEPTAGVDVELRQSLWRFIRRLHGQGHTIVLTTHYLEEAESLCQRIAILKDGRIAGIGRPEELKKQLSRDLRIELKFNPANAPVAKPGFRFEVRRPDHWVFFAEWSETVKLLESLRDDQLESIRVHSPTLEDLYVHYVAEP